MPIYEYVCLDCKKEYEILRSFDEAEKPFNCEDCGGENVKRKLSLAFAHSGGSTASGMGSGGGGCSSCAGGNCSSCGH